MEEDEWFIHFVDDPCDDISGRYLQLWTKLTIDVVEEMPPTQ